MAGKDADGESITPKVRHGYFNSDFRLVLRDEPLPPCVPVVVTVEIVIRKPEEA